MNRWRWQLLQAWRTGGLLLWVASALLLLCALYAGLVAWPAALQVQRLMAQNQALMRQPVTGAETANAVTPAAQTLLDIEQRLAGPSGITQTLGRLAALAASHGVLLQEAQFKLLPGAPDEPFAQYTMELPVQAEYPALRRFLADLLREQPALALHAVALQREGAGAAAAAAAASSPMAARPGLTARLRLVLYLAKAG